MQSVKHTIRDVIIEVVCVLGIARRYREHKVQRGPLVRVLCFHDVPNRTWFVSVLDLLQENYHIITPNEFHDMDFHQEKINILLTFDDGYQSWVDIVSPELEKRGMEGLFFITSGLLNAAEEGEEAVTHFVYDRLRLTTVRRVLTWSGAQTLVSAGHTIGGHTISHADLAQITMTEAEREMEQDKKAIEAHLGITLEDFAYPFGTKDYYNQAVQEATSIVGYEYVYTAESSFAKLGQLQIPRTLVEEGQSHSSLTRWVEGGYDIFVGIAYGIRKTSR